MSASFFVVDDVIKQSNCQSCGRRPIRVGEINKPRLKFLMPVHRKTSNQTSNLDLRLII